MRYLILIITLTYLSSCIYDPDGYAKKSINGKLFESKAASKRRPIYNKKYIDRAKHNILENRYDDEDADDFDDFADETIDPSEVNIRMYKNMIKEEIRNKERRKRKYENALYGESKDEMGDLNISNKKLENKDSKNDQQNLKKELDQIKVLLKETKKELTKSRCSVPLSAEKEYQSTATSLPKEDNISKQLKE